MIKIVPVVFYFFSSSSEYWVYYIADFKAENMTTDIELLILDLLMRAKTLKCVDNKAANTFYLICKDYMLTLFFISFSILYINTSLKVFISL